MGSAPSTSTAIWTSRRGRYVVFIPREGRAVSGARPDRKCCAVAESYGVLLYCNTFSANEIRVITASPEFASRLPKLFRKAFGVSFDRLPPGGAEGKRTLSITDADKLSAIFDAFGADRGATLSHHINFGVIEEDCCRASFIRGAVFSGRQRHRSGEALPPRACDLAPQRQPRGVFDHAGHGLQPEGRRAPETACSTSSRPTPLPTSSRRLAQAARPWTS